jgi:hypothetical protein
MSRGSREQEVLSNKFGTITEKQITFLSDKDLFKNGSREEMPLRQVVSVRFYQQKSFIAIITGILGILFSLAGVTLLRGNLVTLTIAALIITLCVWIAYLGIAGFPTVAITTAEGKITHAKGWPNDRSEAKAFALVLREKIGG